MERSLGWGWSWGRIGLRDKVGVGDGVGDEVGLEVEFGGESKFSVKARNLGTRRGGPAAQTYLVW